MIIAVVIAVAMFLLTLAAHAVVTRQLAASGYGSESASALVGLCAVLLLLTLVEVGVFAVGYEIGSALGIGSFEKPEHTGFISVYYFSLATFATLGLGKVMPTGHLAFIAGVEAIVGFLCITLSASSVFQAVQGPRDS